MRRWSRRGEARFRGPGRFRFDFLFQVFGAQHARGSGQITGSQQVARAGQVTGQVAGQVTGQVAGSEQITGLGQITGTGRDAQIAQSPQITGQRRPPARLVDGGLRPISCGEGLALRSTAVVLVLEPVAELLDAFPERERVRLGRERRELRAQVPSGGARARSGVVNGSGRPAGAR